jgi:multicomponent Na+:H+ antiporter subunit G
MMDMAFDVLAWAFIVAGLFFMLVGTIGVLRMPDVYTRLHAAGMTDTMGAGFLLAGMAVVTIEGMLHHEPGYGFVLIRLALTYAFLLFTSPIATHALARAGLAGGVQPWTNEGEGDS